MQLGPEDVSRFFGCWLAMLSRQLLIFSLSERLYFNFRDLLNGFAESFMLTCCLE
jgi:hypothetical protein